MLYVFQNLVITELCDRKIVNSIISNVFLNKRTKLIRLTFFDNLKNGYFYLDIT